jgi:hypothetical protein
MRPELKSASELLTMLLVLPFHSKEELATWVETANQLDQTMRDNWEWFTGIEFHEMQHLIKHPSSWRKNKDWQECYKDLMIGYLNDFSERVTPPPD